MEYIAKDLLERILDLSDIACDDDTRFSITGVYIVSTGKKVALTATNGHMLATREMVRSFPKGKWMLRNDAVRALRAVIKDHKKLDNVPFTEDPAGVLVGDISRALIEVYSGDYPDYKRVIPTAPEHPASITLNAEYLLTLAKVLQDGEKRGVPSVRLVFDATDPQRALMVQVGDSDITAVVMPMRDDKAKSIARELKAKLEPEPAQLRKAE
jgi:DNA polymerase III sliding clamp (beta) subunit (PCNA family)